MYDPGPTAIYPTGGPNGELRLAQASQSVQKFVFLFQLQTLIMQSIGKALVYTLLLVMGKVAKIQNAERNCSNWGSVLLSFSLLAQLPKRPKNTNPVPPKAP